MTVTRSDRARALALIILELSLLSLLTGCTSHRSRTIDAQHRAHELARKVEPDRGDRPDLYEQDWCSP